MTEATVTNSTPAVITPAVAADTAVQNTAPEVKAQEATPEVKVETPEVKVETKTEAVKLENTSILGEEVKKPEVKAEEIKPAEEVKVEAEVKTEEVKKDEGEQSDEPAPLPTYELKLPEEITLDNARLGEFTKEIGEFEQLTKADHAQVQEFAQKLVDRHIADVQESVKKINDGYVSAWNKQVNDWKESFINDPEIGGNRQNTTKNAALEFIGTHGGTETQQAEFKKLMNETGVGNHPALIRLFANAMEAYREGKPLPANRPPAVKKGLLETFYGSKN